MELHKSRGSRTLPSNTGVHERRENMRSGMELCIPRPFISREIRYRIRKDRHCPSNTNRIITSTQTRSSTTLSRESFPPSPHTLKDLSGLVVVTLGRGGGSAAGTFVWRPAHCACQMFRASDERGKRFRLKFTLITRIELVVISPHAFQLPSKRSLLMKDVPRETVQSLRRRRSQWTGISKNLLLFVYINLSRLMDTEHE